MDSSASGTTVGADRTFKTLNPCVVPKVKGKPLRAPKHAIRAAHRSLGKVTKDYSASVAKGRVVSQEPKPHTHKPSGAKVKLVVSLGPKP